MKLVINLPTRVDRRSEVTRELQKVGWDAEFFPAIRPDDAAGFPSIGARGCFLSHLEALKLARSRGVDRLFLMEDDLNFAKGLQSSWPAVERFLSDDRWRLFYPAHTMTDQHLGITQVPSDKSFTCTHFMIFDRAGIDICIDGLETILARPPGHSLGGPMHVDGAYATLRGQRPELITYAHFPSLGYQRSSRSDIVGPNWIDRHFPVGTKVARKIKSTIWR